MTTADNPSNEAGVSIITENALAKVEKYLNQNKTEKAIASSKKKLLVVDDSEFGALRSAGRIWFFWIMRCLSAKETKFWK